MAKKLSLKVIQSYDFPETEHKPDHDDLCLNFETPNGIVLTGYVVMFNRPCKTDSLFAFDDWVYLETKKELDEFLKMTYDEVLEMIVTEMISEDCSNEYIEDVTGFDEDEIEIFREKMKG